MLDFKEKGTKRLQLYARLIMLDFKENTNRLHYLILLFGYLYVTSFSIKDERKEV